MPLHDVPWMDFFCRSLGVALWEVCSFAQWPYDEMSNEEVIQSVITSGKCCLENPLEPNDPIAHL